MKRSSPEPWRKDGGGSPVLPCRECGAPASCQVNAHYRDGVVVNYWVCQDCVLPLIGRADKRNMQPRVTK